MTCAPASSDLTYSSLRLQLPSDRGGLGGGALGRPIPIHQLQPNDQPPDGDPKPGLVKRFFRADGQCDDGFIVQAAAGEAHCLYLSMPGNVYMHGSYSDADRKMLKSDGSDGSHASPVHVPLPRKAIEVYSGSAANYSAALLEDGSLVTWGVCPDGQRLSSFSTPAPVMYASPPTVLMKILSVACGELHMVRALL
jgi:hypothetical protein